MKIKLVIALLICATLFILACGASAADYLERGDRYSDSEQWDEAIAEYGRAIELDPDLALAYFNRATAYSIQGQHDLAIADLNNVIELSTETDLTQRAEQRIGELEQDVLRQSLEEVGSEVVEIRGLTPKNEVETQFITTDELRDLIVGDLEEEYPQEKAVIDQEVYVLLDLMEEDQDLYGILVDVLTEQVIGFYNDESGELYVVSDKEEFGPMQRLTFAHEYTHALQDQYFDLSSLPLDVEDNSDMSMAVLALVEGDGTRLIFDYMLGKFTGAELRAVIQGTQESDGERFEAAPRFIQEDLLFPYVEGMNFVLSLGAWEGVNQAYGDLPQSTEQILHPEKYLERDEPQDVNMPDLEGALGEGWSQLDSDVLGELYVRIYLETFVSEETAAVAAAGWDGDRYVYLKNTEGEKLLVLRSIWDSDMDAGEFFDAYNSFVEGKSGSTWDMVLEEKTERQWVSGGLNVYLGRNGSDVLIIIAPNEEVSDRVLVEFPAFLN